MAWHTVKKRHLIIHNRHIISISTENNNKLDYVPLKIPSYHNPNLAWKTSKPEDVLLPSVVTGLMKYKEINNLKKERKYKHIKTIKIAVMWGNQKSDIWKNCFN